MLVITGLFEGGNFIKLPDAFCEQWELKKGDSLYARLISGKLLLSQEEHKHAVRIEIVAGLGIVLIDIFIKVLGFEPGDRVVFVLKNNQALLYKNVVRNYQPESNKEKLNLKIELEFQANRQSRYSLMMEDIYNYIIWNEWEDNVVDRLLDKPNLLEELMFDFLTDDDFHDFFEVKMRELVLSLAASE